MTVAPLAAPQDPADAVRMSDTDPLPAALGRPASRALTNAGYRTVGDVRGASERDLLALHGVGPRAVRILREHGVELAP